MGGIQTLQAQIHDAQIKIASDYNFRGLYQHFNENNRPSSQLTIHSKLAFWSESGFMVGGESANVTNDFEIQGKAGFKLPLIDGAFSAIYHRFQYQNKTDFEEVHYALSSSITAITYIQGLNQAGDAVLVDYQWRFPAIALGLHWGDFKPSDTQLGLNNPGNGEFYRISLTQPFLGAALALSYTDRYNMNENAWIISLGSQWQQPSTP